MGSPHTTTIVTTKTSTHIAEPENEQDQAVSLAMSFFVMILLCYILLVRTKSEVGWSGT